MFFCLQNNANAQVFNAEILVPNGQLLPSWNTDIMISKNARQILFYFENDKAALQTGRLGRDGWIYDNNPDNSLVLNPLGGDTKIGHNLLVKKNLQMGNSFKMSNPSLTNNFNSFEIFFENNNNNADGDSKIIFKNYKQYGGSFAWQNLDEDNQAQDLMRLENGNLRVGQVFTGKVTIRINYWQDRVFEANYPLMPLSQVEEFIKINKHLPEVPAEKEIIENGLSVADMQATQMQKIEELMLYLIEQNKQIQALQEENKALLKRLEALENKKP